MYTYSWFTLLYVRNWHNIVKQLYSNYKIKFFNLRKKKKKPHWTFIRCLSSGPVYQRLDSLNSKSLLLTVLEARRPKVPADSVCGERCFLVWRWYPDTVGSRERKQALLSLLIQDTDSIQKDSTWWPAHPAKAPSPNAIIWGVRISTYEPGGWERNKHTVHNSGVLWRPKWDIAFESNL